jgi:hypothetical protein
VQYSQIVVRESHPAMTTLRGATHSGFASWNTSIELIESVSSFEPHQVKTLGEAFDIAWEQIAPSTSKHDAHKEIARIVLADLIFSLARHGYFDSLWLAENAARIVLSRQGRGSTGG